MRQWNLWRRSTTGAARERQGIPKSMGKEGAWRKCMLKALPERQRRQERFA